MSDNTLASASNSGSGVGPMRPDLPSRSSVRFSGFNSARVELSSSSRRTSRPAGPRLCTSNGSTRPPSTVPGESSHNVYEELQQLVPGVVVGRSSEADTVRAAIRYIEQFREVIEDKDRLLECALREASSLRRKYERLIMKCESLLEDSDASEDESG